VARPAESATHGVSRVALRLERAAGRVERGGSPGVPVLYLGGEFDFDTVPEVDRFLRRRLGPLYQRHTLLMDLRDVTLVDSSFIGFVVRLVGEQRRGNGELVLVRPVGRVRALLRTVGLPNLVPVYDSLEEGLGALREARSPLIPPAYGVAG
jgi:anti-anti-sigma factor